MDCASCGLANPPEAPNCDCGFDFSTGKPPDFHGWEIRLAWRQKLAAFWSISWPAWMGWLLTFSFLAGRYSLDDLPNHAWALGMAGNAVFFAIQALLTGRLARKDYRSFRLYVVRDDGSKGRHLSPREALSIWLWIFAGQLAFSFLMSVVVGLLLAVRPAATLQGFMGLSQLLLFLLVGPYSAGFALRRKYAAFRLEAHGFRYV